MDPSIKVRTKACQCPACNAPIDAASPADGTPGEPSENDPTICINCGAMLVFNADTTVRKMTVDDFKSYPMDIQNELGLAALSIGMTNITSGRTK